MYADVPTIMMFCYSTQIKNSPHLNVLVCFYLYKVILCQAKTKITLKNRLAASLCFKLKLIS